MLWKTHLRITKEVMRKLRVSLSFAENSFLQEGVIAPDKWKNYPHHHGKSNEIKHHLVTARCLFLNGDLLNAYYNLGVALHYIQDSYTSFASFYPNHQSWEQQIEDSYFVNDLEGIISRVLQNNQYQRDRCLWLAQMLSREIQGRDNTLIVATLSGQGESRTWAKPIVDLNLGLKASFVVSKSVLSPKNCPELDSALSNNLKEHQKLLQNAEVSLSQEIFELVKKRDRLKSRIIQDANFAGKIKNWIFSIRTRLTDHRIDGKMRDYTKRIHLQKVIGAYQNATHQIVFPHQGWYNCPVPQIDVDVVKRDLVSIQEIAAYFGVNAFVVRALLQKADGVCFYAGNSDVIRRPELDRVLSQFPINGFNEYPV